jgi:peptidoglycan/xylan/chitin deacetylase (PgdA/CDA1 family)
MISETKETMAASGNPRLAGPGYGAFVVSLDFELHWGVRDHEPPHGPYRQNLLGARKAIPPLLELFKRYGIAGTWAVIGFLFAVSAEERRKFEPALRPCYYDKSLDPYVERIGKDEDDDPLHFAPSLIEQIRRTPDQEIATHTFSHHYCLEPGQTLETFKADLNSAIAIAADRGIRLRSIVFPRNQMNPDYAQAVLDAGIICYRGPEYGWMHRGIKRQERRLGLRVARIADTYIDISGKRIIRWDRILEPGGLCNVRASRFLWPYRPKLKRLEEKRLKRMIDQIKFAAMEDAIFHIWFHPHNFGVHLEENLKVLEAILQAFAFARERYGMRSLSMSAVSDMVRTGFGLPQTQTQKPVARTTREESVPA